MSPATRFGTPGLVLAVFSACGVSANRAPDGAAATEAGVCGTSAQPGTLKLAHLSPPMGATVANQTIAHGFTVLDAPAEFNNFELRFGPSHTAGLPAPEKPRFTMIRAETDIIYQLTIDAWSTAPGHVELLASGGFQTKKGCAWVFPSPLFSYDLIAGPDGGLVREAGGGADTPAQPIDGAQVVYRLDAPMKYDLATREAGGVLDAEADASIDATRAAVDSTDDKPVLAVDAGID